MKKNFNELILSCLDKNQYTFDCNDDTNPEITSLVFDSRKATENTLYFAWSGVHVHGNSFIPKAIENGCKAIIYEEDENHLVPEETNNLAKAKGVALVFEKNSLLYVDPAQGIDLTAEARTALNIPEGRTLETLQAELQAKAQAAQTR